MKTRKKCLSEWSEEPQDKMIKRFFALRAQNDRERLGMTEGVSGVLAELSAQGGSVSSADKSSELDHYKGLFLAVSI
jgi:hypothetical protein